MTALLREWVKRLPLAGPLLYRLYLKTFFRDDGEVVTIRNGRLAGHRWARYMRTHQDDYVYGNYELELQDAIAKHLRAGMTFYDVGANGGFFTLLAASIVGRQGSVAAFEPHPETARQLKQQLKINGLHAAIYVGAVSDKVGVALLKDDTASVMASLTDGRDGHFCVTVPTTTLDQAKWEYPAPNLIKIVVEGAQMKSPPWCKEFATRKKAVTTR
jgi:FkbM family methyltransferase